MNPPVADLMYLSSETAGDLDLESKKCKGLNVKDLWGITTDD